MKTLIAFLTSILIIQFYTADCQTFQKVFFDSEDWEVVDVVDVGNGEMIALIMVDEVLKLSRLDVNGELLLSFNLTFIEKSNFKRIEHAEIKLLANGDLLVIAYYAKEATYLIISQAGVILHRKQYEWNCISSQNSKWSKRLTVLPEGRMMQFNKCSDRLIFTILNSELEMLLSREIKAQSDLNILAVASNEQFIVATIWTGTQSVVFKFDLYGNLPKSTKIEGAMITDIEIDLDNNIVMHALPHLIKLDSDLNMVWALENSLLVNGMSFSDRLFIDQAKNIYIETMMGASFDEHSFSLITKFDENGQTKFSKMLIDNNAASNSGIYQIENSLLVVEESASNDKILRKLDLDGESDTCPTEDFCTPFSFGEVNIFQGQVFDPTNEQFEETADVEIIVEFSSHLLTEICNAALLPHSSFELKHDTICVDVLNELIVESVYPYGVSTWEIFDGSDAVVSQGTGKDFEFELSQSGDYTIVHHLSVGGCEYIDEIEFHVYPNLQSDQLESIYEVCAGEELFLTLDETNITDILWSTSSKEVQFVSEEAGEYSVEFADEYGCQHTESFTIALLGLPLITLVTDTVLCDGEELILDPIVIDSDGLQWSEGSVTTSISVEVTGDYAVTAYNECGDTTATVSVEFVYCEQPNAEFEVESDSICGLWVDVIPESIYNGGTSQWQLIDSNEELISESDDPAFVAFLMPEEGWYSMIHILTFEGMTYRDTVALYVFPDTNELDSIYQICEGSQFTVELDDTVVSDVIWSNGIDGLEFETSSVGTYSVEYIDANGCESSESFILEEETVPVISLISDTVLCDGNLLTLEPVLTNSENVEWQDGSVMEAIEIMNPGDYQVTASNNCGEASATVSVALIDCEARLFVPNIMAHNGDQENSRFKVSGVNVKVIKCLIFDRWGNQIYRTTTESIEWDGTFKNQKVNPGVYVYFIEYFDYFNEVQTETGSITVI